MLLPRGQKLKDAVLSNLADWKRDLGALKGKVLTIIESDKAGHCNCDSRCRSQACATDRWTPWRVSRPRPMRNSSSGRMLSRLCSFARARKMNFSFKASVSFCWRILLCSGACRFLPIFRGQSWGWIHSGLVDCQIPLEALVQSWEATPVLILIL